MPLPEPIGLSLPDLLLDHPEETKRRYLSRSSSHHRRVTTWCAAVAKTGEMPPTTKLGIVVSTYTDGFMAITPQSIVLVSASAGKPPPYLRLRLPVWKISSMTGMNFASNSK